MCWLIYKQKYKKVMEGQLYDKKILIHFHNSFILVTCYWNIRRFDVHFVKKEKIYSIKRRRWHGFFISFWQKNFQITFKCLQNIVILCFQFMKFSWQKYNVLGADEDDRMLFLHNKLLLYIFKCKWNRETGQFIYKNFELSSI